jgi:hypothetical protein
MKKTFHSYDNLVKSTTEVLEARLESIDEYLGSISGQTSMGSGSDTAEVGTINEERQSTQRCLQICAHFSEHLTKVQLTSNDSDSSPQWMIVAAYSNFTVIDNYGMGDNVQWAVSTSKKIIRVRNRCDGFRNRQFAGDMNDASVQTVSRSFAHHASWVPSTEDRSPSSRGGTTSVSDNEEATMAGANTWERRGPGFKLSYEESSGKPKP